MKYVLTLIGNPADGGLSPAVADKVGAAMGQAGAMTEPMDWLAPRRAVDIVFDGQSPARALAIARDEIGDLPIDLHAQPVAGRRRQLLVSDMDSTIIAVETIDELASALGKREEVAAITEAAMAGELDYADSLRARTKLFTGLNESELDRVYAERVALNTGARELVATMNKFGAVTALVSGGFSYFAERVATDLGFQFQHANQLEIVDGTLTGFVEEPIITGPTKREIIERTANEHGIELPATMGIGDGANDIDLLDSAGIGIAYRAKPILAECADVCINHTDLRTALYLQGFRDSDITDD
jgi:phosphoserine phosphatase